MPRPRTIPKLLVRKSPSTGNEIAYAKFAGKTVTFGAMGPAARREFELTLARWLASGRTFNRGPAADYSVAQLVVDYKAHARIYYRHLADGSMTASVDRIEKALELLTEMFGVLQAKDFDLPAIKVYRDQIVADGLSRVTVNGKVQVVKQAFTWAAEENKIPPEVAARLKLLRALQRGRSAARDLPPRRPVEWADVEATLPHLPTGVQAIVRTMWHTAMRVGEVVQMCGRMVDMTGDVWVFRPTRFKTQHHGKSREIDIGMSAQAVLKPFVKLAKDEPWFSPADSLRDHLDARRRHRKTPLYESHVQHMEAKRSNDPQRTPGAAYTPRTVAKAIERAIERANRDMRMTQADGSDGEPRVIPRWSSHQLRYAALTRFRQMFGIEAALAAAGHSSFATTDIYSTSARRELARRVAAEIG